MLCNFVLILVLALSATASLRDVSYCDPLRKDMRKSRQTPLPTHQPAANSTRQAECPPDPAFAGSATFNFSGSSWDQDTFKNFWLTDQDTSHDHERRLNFTPSENNSLAINVYKSGDAPTLISRKYLFFGRVSVTLQAAQGNGIITAVTLKSDSGDEINWELLGAYKNQATTNYFFNGKALFNTYNDTFSLPTSSWEAMHTYTIEWTDSLLRFFIDGEEKKTWLRGQNFVRDEAWPQRPMRVKVGVWVVGEGADGGEVSWAGGRADWAGGDEGRSARFVGVHVDDYMGGCTKLREDAGGGKVRYRYDARSQDWRSVFVDGCEARNHGGQLSRPEDEKAPPAEASPTAHTADDSGDGKNGKGEKEGEEDGAGRGVRISGTLVVGLWLWLGWWMLG